MKSDSRKTWMIQAGFSAENPAVPVHNPPVSHRALFDNYSRSEVRL